MRPVLLLLATLLVVAEADAQTLATLQPGQRVRVTIPSRDLRDYEETIYRVDGDTLVLGSIWCSLSDVTQLDVYKRSHGYSVLGAFVGVLGGAALGWTIGASSNCETSSGAMVDLSCMQKPMAGGLLGAMAGGALGGLLGSSLDSGYWKGIPLDQHRVTIGAGRGLGIWASIAF